MPRERVEIGSRFSSVGHSIFGRPSSDIWCVSEIVEKSDRIVYARLVRESDQCDMKTISLTALQDGRLFRRWPGMTAA